MYIIHSLTHKYDIFQLSQEIALEVNLVSRNSVYEFLMQLKKAVVFS